MLPELFQKSLKWSETKKNIKITSLSGAITALNLIEHLLKYLKYTLTYPLQDNL